MLPGDVVRAIPCDPALSGGRERDVHDRISLMALSLRSMAWRPRGADASPNAIAGAEDPAALIGGAGLDTFIFRKGEAAGDTMMDFKGQGTTDIDSTRFERSSLDAHLTTSLITLGPYWTARVSRPSPSMTARATTCSSPDLSCRQLGATHRKHDC